MSPSAVRLRHLVDYVVEKSDGEASPYLGLEGIESGTGRLVDTELPEKGAADSIVYRPGDVLFGKLRPYLAKSWLATRPGTGSGELMVLRARPGLNARFLLYSSLGRAWLDWAELNSYGSKMPRTSWEEMADLRLPDLDVSRQEVIADFLDQETARIDATINAQRRLVNRLIERRTAKILDSVAGATVNLGPVKPSAVEWMPYIPAHWQMAPLRRFARIETGVTPPSEDRNNYSDDQTEYPWVTPEDLDPSGQPTVASRHLTEEGWKHVRPVPSGASLVCCIGATLGKVGILASRASTNQQITAVISTLDKRFTFYALLASFDGLRSAASGNTLPILNQDKLGSVRLPVPPPAEQRAIADELDRDTGKISAMIERSEASIALLRERRTALITAAVTGQVDPRTGTELLDGMLEVTAS